jgi:hypothetical protein
MPPLPEFIIQKYIYHSTLAASAQITLFLKISKILLLSKNNFCVKENDFFGNIQAIL